MAVKIIAANDRVVFSKPISEWVSASVDIDPKTGSAWVSIRIPSDLGMNVGDRLVNSVIKTYPDVSQFWTYDKTAFLKNPVYSRDYPPAKNLEP